MLDHLPRRVLLRTRNPGRTIVDESILLHSEVIYLGTVHAPARERGLGPTATYLLAARPCRVVVETGPDRPGQPAAASGRPAGAAAR